MLESKCCQLYTHSKNKMALDDADYYFGFLNRTVFCKETEHFCSTYSISICKEWGTRMEVMVENLKTAKVKKMLQERSISFEVAVSDTSPLGASRMTLRPTPPAPYKFRKKRIIDWKDYYPLENIYAFMESLEIQYPSICTVVDIGRTVEGRNIKMIKISNSDAKNTAVWLDGAIHAREWISTSVVTYITDQIVKNFNTLGKSVTNKDWYILPVVNPDGYHHSFTMDRMWRKSRARTGNVITGVDLNRNFSHYWGQNGSDMSSGDPHHLNYRGTAPFSEPESAALKDIILYSGTPFKIFLTFHAYSEVISFPWCFTAEPCADYVNLLEGGTCMAKAIYETNGRMYKIGNFKDIMYYACGTSIDWSYGTARIPFTYLVELRSKQTKFLLPKEEIRDCCREVYNGVMALAKFVDTKNCIKCTVFDRG